MTSVEQSELHAFNENQAARYIGVSGAVLRLWRSESKGPRFFRAGEKLVRYRKTDLDSWIEARLSAPAALEAR
jgi:predicted DNA-binding transcriptional regulator AlpA